MSTARGTRPVRIANCSGFYGDRMTGLAEAVGGGPVDIVTGDYLAEVTMLVLAKSRLKDPSAGYARTFLPQLEPVAKEIEARGIKVVVNAGGLNPAGLAAATRELLDRLGVGLAVTYVEGDDVLPALTSDDGKIRHLVTGAPVSEWPYEPLTANAYLGGFGVARALAGGADIVITGRAADASVVTGAAAWWWDWTPGDLDALAGAVAAGHIIECSGQAAGGNFSGFQTLPGMEKTGFPIAEISRDGSAVITKHEGTGGAVTVDTVTAQLLYEIGNPAYLNSDVTTHLDTLRLTQAGPDRVAVSGARGTPPPSTTKVAVTGIGGWANSAFYVFTGLDIDAKIDLFERTVRMRTAGDPGIHSVTFTRIGTAQADPADQFRGTELVKVEAQGTKEAAGRPFSSMLVEMALCGYPGNYRVSPPGDGSSFGVYWPGLIEQADVPHRVVHADGRVETVAPPPEFAPVAAPEVSPPPPAVPDESPLVTAPLGRVAYARSGDKGGDANVGIWAPDAEAWPWLRATLTTERVRELLPEAAKLEISRYELGNLKAVNFVIHGLLGEGATSTTRLDGQAKALGEWVRARQVQVPERLLHGDRPGA
ncbi:MAG: acyclic terpene utilization AtuA family protein [Streptosporangiales bacterium]|nr:acyclic terpene utilization AtuA family protein [Streptosporangiales bacterium]